MSFLVPGNVGYRMAVALLPLVFVIFARELLHRQPEPFLNISVAVGGIV